MRIGEPLIGVFDHAAHAFADRDLAGAEQALHHDHVEPPAELPSDLALAPDHVEALGGVQPDGGGVAADDPRVMRAQARVDPLAVGKRLWLRAVGPAKVELSYAPPGEEPGKNAPRWAFDLLAAVSERV